MVENWYMQNLVKIGPHTKKMAEGIKQEKLDELRDADPMIENSSKIWEGVLPRLFVTITGENYLYNETVQDILQMIQFETDPERIEWLLNTLYKIRNIPIPPKKEEQSPEMQEALAKQEQEQPQQGKKTQPRQEGIIEALTPTAE
jgi:virulence-associated protein VapD